MVSRSPAVLGGVGDGVWLLRTFGAPRRRATAENNELPPELALVCVPQGRRSGMGVPATKHTCTSVLGRCGSCSGLLYVAVLAHAALHASAPLARGRTRGRLSRAFDEHLREPSYSFHGFFRPGLAVRH